MNSKIPRKIEFPKIGNPTTGYISVAEKKNLLFIPKRIYWTYFTPEMVERGAHAHIELEQLIVAVSGTIEFTLINKQNEREIFILDNPDKGLYIPNGYWREIKFSHNAVLLCMASEKYDEKDYIRDFNDFIK